MMKAKRNSLNSVNTANTLQYVHQLMTQSVLFVKDSTNSIINIINNMIKK